MMKEEKKGFGKSIPDEQWQNIVLGSIVDMMKEIGFMMGVLGTLNSCPCELRVSVTSRGIKIVDQAKELAEILDKRGKDDKD